MLRVSVIRKIVGIYGQQDKNKDDVRKTARISGQKRERPLNMDSKEYIRTLTAEAVGLLKEMVEMMQRLMQNLMESRIQQKMRIRMLMTQMLMVQMMLIMCNFTNILL